MNRNHLTDDTLQAFLLKEIQDDTINQHLAICPDCRKKLEDYEALVGGIQKVAPESFAFDVTHLVMDSILKYEKQESKKHDFIFWGFWAILLMAISAFSIPFIPQILAVFYSIPFFATVLIMGTALAVMVFLLADLNNQYQLKEKKIF